MRKGCELPPISAWKPSFAGSSGQKNRPRVVEADALDSGDVGRFAARQVEQVGVVEPALGSEAEGPVLLLPLAVLGTLPAAAEDGDTAVGRPAGELRPGVLFAGRPSARMRRPLPSALTSAARIVVTLTWRPPGRSVRNSV